MSMQVDAEIHKEQNGTLFCLVGALEGGFGGWGVPQGCPPQKVYVSSKKNKKTPSWRASNCVHVLYGRAILIAAAEFMLWC